MQEMQAEENVLKYHEFVAQHIRENRLPPTKLVLYMKRMNFSMVPNPELILNNNRADIIRKHGFETISIDGKYYIHIITPFFRILLEDNIHRYEQNYLDVFIFIVFGLLFAFIAILKQTSIYQRLEKSAIARHKVA